MILDRNLCIEDEFGEVLSEFVSKKKPSTCVEIGTGQGFSTYHILKSLNKNKHGKLYTFDPVDRSPYFWEEKRVRTERLKIILSNFGLKPKSIPESIDFVFHDAGHWFEHVEKDLSLVIPRMPVGGVIFIHDIIYSFDMGEKLKIWFEKKEDWIYTENKTSCGLGMGEKIK